MKSMLTQLSTKLELKLKLSLAINIVIMVLFSTFFMIVLATKTKKVLTSNLSSLAML